MNKKILKLRNKVDKIDDKICRLLKKRFQTTKEIMYEKKRINSGLDDLNREKEIIQDKLNKYELNKDFIISFYNLIFKESKK